MGKALPLACLAVLCLLGAAQATSLDRPTFMVLGRFFSDEYNSTTIGKELSALLKMDDVAGVTYLFHDWVEKFEKTFSSPAEVSPASW